MSTEKRTEYFKWLCSKVCNLNVPFNYILEKLFNTDFTYTLKRDRSRAVDGLDLRDRYTDEIPYSYDRDIYYRGCQNRPCSILEMMVALAIRCEDTLMDDDRYGDRTGQWFWVMMNSLGAGSLYDDIYTEEKADAIIDRFLSHEYEPDGRGGLFYIRHCDYDLRDVEIWCQMCWYLDSLVG